jgi:hypothetical protein
VVSSTTWCTHPHVHGVESKLRGRFWAVDSESESESDDEVIDQLSCYMKKMSISSPVGSPGFIPPSTSISSDIVVSFEQESEGSSVAHSGSSRAFNLRRWP